MFQDPVASLSPRKTVRSLLLEPFRIHRIPLPEPEAAVRRLLAMVGLHDGILGAYPHQLSGGQARRVGVARTLALNPDLIIADEPTAGLDVSVQGEVLNLMNELQRRLGLTYVIVTHNLPVIRHVSDRLVIMYLGRIVEEGATADVFAGPAHPYTRGLLTAVRSRTQTSAGTGWSSKARSRACASGPRAASFTRAVPTCSRAAAPRRRPCEPSAAGDGSAATSRWGRGRPRSARHT